MFNLLKRAVGLLTVDEGREYITVSNIPLSSILQDIYSIWNTRRIEKHLFDVVTGKRIRFRKFYAIEVLYILKEIKDLPTTSLAKRRTYQAIINKLKEETWLSSIDENDVPSLLDRRTLREFKKTPLPHQEEFFKEYEQNMRRYRLRGYMLGSPAGSGKTLMGLMLAYMSGAKKIIVVCPKNAVERVWLATIRDEFRSNQGDVWDSVSGRTMTGREKFYVTHYHALDTLLSQVRMFTNSGAFVILDESHNLNEIKSDRTQNFVSFCSSIDPISVLWASGTPIKALGKEMIPFLSTIDRFFTDDVRVSFAKIFGMSQSRASEILANRLGISSYRVDKKVVVDGEPIESTVTVSFPGAARYTLSSIGNEMKEFILERMAYYSRRYDTDKKAFDDCISYYRSTLVSSIDKRALDEYLKDVKVLSKAKDLRPLADMMVSTNMYERKHIIPALPDNMKKTFRDVKSIIKYVSLKVRGEALGRILSKRRSECAVDMVKHIGLGEIVKAADKKTLIFSSYVDAVEEAANYMKQEGYKPLIVHGGTNKNLPSIIRSFEQDKDLDPLIATYQSLSTAVPMIMANVVVLMNQPFRSYERIQAISRVHRLGQDTQVYVVNVLLETDNEPNVSTRSMDIMKWSQEQVDAIMGIQTTHTEDMALEAVDISDVDEMSLEDLECYFGDTSLYLHRSEADLLEQW